MSPIIIPPMVTRSKSLDDAESVKLTLLRNPCIQPDYTAIVNPFRLDESAGQINLRCPTERVPNYQNGHQNSSTVFRYHSRSKSHSPVFLRTCKAIIPSDPALRKDVLAVLVLGTTFHRPQHIATASCVERFTMHTYCPQTQSRLPRSSPRRHFSHCRGSPAR